MSVWLTGTTLERGRAAGKLGIKLSTRDHFEVGMQTAAATAGAIGVGYFGAKAARGLYRKRKKSKIKRPAQRKARKR